VTNSSKSARADAFREQTGRKYDYADHRPAYLDMLRVCTDNFLAALAEGDATEALAWATLANSHTFQYRKAV
jgi:hypothetical protein